jgi:hypothetical protein
MRVSSEGVVVAAPAKSKENIMKRHMLASLVAVFLLAGCSAHKKMMEPPQKPEPAPEMAKLKMFLGIWHGTAEIVEPSPEEMKAHMPEGEEMPETFKGGGTYSWALGGTALKAEGWHEMGEDQKANYVEYLMWDPKKGKFRTLYASDWGDSGSGCAWFDEDGKTMYSKGQGVNHEGIKVRGEGSLTFVDSDTIEWTWTEWGKHGKMKFKGTSHRKR